MGRRPTKIGKVVTVYINDEDFRDALMSLYYAELDNKLWTKGDEDIEPSKLRGISSYLLFLIRLGFEQRVKKFDELGIPIGDDVIERDKVRKFLKKVFEEELENEENVNKHKADVERIKRRYEKLLSGFQVKGRL